MLPTDSCRGGVGRSVPMLAAALSIWRVFLERLSAERRNDVERHTRKWGADEDENLGKAPLISLLSPAAIPWVQASVLSLHSLKSISHL